MEGINGRGSTSKSRRDNIIYVPDAPFNASPQVPYDYSSLSDSDPVICIDNGSHSWRAGFSTREAPSIDRLNIVSRYKERKQGRNVMLFGKDTEADANARANVRQMFDGDMLIHGDLLECALDYTFITLGIDTPRIEHPVVMTERLANPLFTRASTIYLPSTDDVRLISIIPVTSELLFELYSAPSVTYGIDSLFAFSRHRHQDGLAVSLGHNASTVIPVVNGRGVLSRAKRIPWGGSQAAEAILKLAQLKYPSFPIKVTPTQAAFVYRELCYFSSDYEDETRLLGDPAKMSAMTQVVQFPYSQPEVAEKSEAELAAAMQRRREQGKRLQEMQARQRAEKLAVKLAELEDYKTLLSERPSLKKAEFLSKLSEMTPFETESELESYIKRTEADIRRKQRKDQGEDAEPEEEPTFPLVDRPDEELNEEEIKEKRRQRLMKSGWEARVKIREEKQRERERLEEEQRQEEAERIRDPSGWATRLREEQEAVIIRMQERKQRRAQLGDRKSAAAQNRMKSIASLAADVNVGKKRKKELDEKDDGFGRDDSDWAVYRQIGNDEESDAEDDDLTQLQSIENRLLQHDSTFSEDDTMGGRVQVKHALINAFVRGGSTERFDADNLEHTHQLHLNVERIRVPETWFQPSMFGLDCAGLGEVAGWVLNSFEERERRRMMQCIVVTGGSANIPNLLNRMRNTLTPVLPFLAPFQFHSAIGGGDPRLEAWKGMAAWSGSDEAKRARVTRQEYDECGGEWLKEHAWGNVPP